MNLSIASQIALNLAVIETQALDGKYIDTEHLFLGLCKVEDILRLDKEAIQNITEEEFQEAWEEIRDFKNFLESNGLDPKKTRRRLRKLLYESQSERGQFSGHRTARCKKVFAIAEDLCKEAGETKISLKHLFWAVLKESSTILDSLFVELSLERVDLLKCLETEKVRGEGETLVMNKQKEEEDSPQPKKTKTLFLDKFGRDLTKLARDGKLDPVIGRKEEIRKVAQILTQKRKNNPILVGDAGTGKTSIVEGLAQRIVKPDAPPTIRNLRIIEINMGSLIAGTKYRGEFEERVDMMIKEATSDPNIVLFIDEIHTIVGAGAAGGSAMDAGNILKPALARGDIKCIGATTTKEYRKYIEKDSALERRFQVVWVDEPTKGEAIFIIKGLKSKFEEHYGLKIKDEVIEKAVELSMRYLTDFRLPDKAIDIIDQACSEKVLRTLSPVELKDKTAPEVTIDDIAKVISERSRIPVEILTLEESERLLRMEEYLRLRVMGQEHAIKEVSDTIRSAKAGLMDPKKPLAVFLFLGSTGTGKTELAKTITEFLFSDENRLIVFDMSEYQERHTVSKLIGAPPGYVGYEEEGQLTSKVRTNPYSVILFDEIEKAHPDVFDIFLQILDEGRLTDTHGRKVNFSETIIIFTSNIGSSITSVKKPIGFNVEELYKTWKDYEEQIYRALVTTFKPEFLNRIQKRIIFYPLTRDTVKSILIEKILKNFNQRLFSKGIEVSLSEDAIEFLLHKGYSEVYGAREIERVFNKYISEPLSQMILKGEVKSGQKVIISKSSEGVDFKIIEFPMS